MKHSIGVKFIAVFLAALALLSAVGSAVGIIGLTALDLYEQSVDELYDENMESTRQTYAVNLVHRYASLQLGHLPESYLEEYYGTGWLYSTFQYGYAFYTIYNEHGDVVESTAADAPDGCTRYETVVTDIRYRAVVQNPLTGTEELLDEVATTPSETIEFPEETLPDSTEVAVTEPELPGTTPTMAEAESIPPTETTAEDMMGALPTEAAADASLTAAKAPELYTDGYYSHELGQFVELTYTYADLPPYTVELYLLPGAMPEEQFWSILRQVWIYRNELFYILAGSLLTFAILAVYLCCAAGKKPGREEVKAGGLNCIPLDLYFLCAGCIIGFVLAFGVEVVEYLLRYSPHVLVPFIFLAGYGCCLIVVGFCFACAAQFKTPGGYVWRNSLAGRCLRGIVILWNAFITCCVWLSAHLPPFMGRIFRKLWVWTVALAHWLFTCALAIWAVAKKCLLYLWVRFKAMCAWCGKKIARFYGLIPLTWQWLLAAFVMIFLAFLAFNSRSGGWLLLCLGLYLAVVLYGTNAFGILMESAKRMSKGDLETKVSDQFLIGSFKEFAGDLNALADVAVVAAQKQLKSERMKTELITNVSHDIKTPLTSIINYVDLLQKPHTPEEQETYLEVLSRQSLQLKKLIDDLIEMSKASTGNMAVDITSVNAGEAVNQALGEFADKLDKAQLIPVFRQPEEPLYMKADGRLVWRVLGNLLSNAVKYALPGTRLYIDLMELEGKVIISMKNISREALNVSADELLERFVRGDASRNTEGSGLGLNIAKSLMELQKGQLQLLVDGDLFKVTLVFPAVSI